MDVATMTMPQEEATRKLEEYRDGLRRRADDEYERARVAFEELAAGRPVLQLSTVIQEAPRDEQGRPRLAIARADRLQVHLSRNVDWRGRWWIYDTAFYTTGRGGNTARDSILQVPDPAVPDYGPSIVGFALVPMVPPAARGMRDLKRYFTLWEVEAWADRRLDQRPDRDPYLLQKVADDLYSVVAEWDLTDVERAVMRNRLR